MKKVMGWLMGKTCLWSEQSFPIISVSGFENTHVRGEGREGNRAGVVGLISHHYCGLRTSEAIQCNANSKCGAETPGLCWTREEETNRSDLESRETVSDRTRRNIPEKRQSATWTII